MTKEEKNFKVLEIKKYEEKIDKEEKSATVKTFLTGLYLAAAMVFFSVLSKDNLDNTTKLLTIGLGLASTGLGVDELKELIKTISQEVRYEEKLDILQKEVNEYREEKFNEWLEVQKEAIKRKNDYEKVLQKKD